MFVYNTIAVACSLPDLASSMASAHIEVSTPSSPLLFNPNPLLKGLVSMAEIQPVHATTDKHNDVSVAIFVGEFVIHFMKEDFVVHWYLYGLMCNSHIFTNNDLEVRENSHKGPQ